jgi:hypothetical protein
VQIQVPRQVQQTTMQTRTHWQQTPKIVEYERAQVQISQPLVILVLTTPI